MNGTCEGLLTSTELLNELTSRAFPGPVVRGFGVPLRVDVEASAKFGILEELGWRALFGVSTGSKA